MHSCMYKPYNVNISFSTMADESDDVSEAGSQKHINSDVFEGIKVEKNYACCSKKCSVVICTFCDEIMHKSCAKKMENVKFIDGFHVNCCESYENMGQKDKDVSENKMDFMEKKMFEMKINFLIQLLESSNEKNEILKLNNTLLLQRINDMECKQERVQENVNKQYIPTLVEHSSDRPINMNDNNTETVTNDPKIPILIYNTPDKLVPDELNKNRLKPPNVKSHKINLVVNNKQEETGNTMKSIKVDVQKNDTDWTTVVKKKRMGQKSGLICTGTKQVTAQSKIKGALRRKWLYVGRISGNEIIEKDIMDFLQNSTGSNEFEVKKLPTKGSNSAFSIGVPTEMLYMKLSMPESWPNGVVLREFNFRNFFRKDTMQVNIIK